MSCSLGANQVIHAYPEEHPAKGMSGKGRTTVSKARRVGFNKDFELFLYNAWHQAPTVEHIVVA